MKSASVLLYIEGSRRKSSSAQFMSSAMFNPQLEHCNPISICFPRPLGLSTLHLPLGLPTSCPAASLGFVHFLAVPTVFQLWKGGYPEVVGEDISLLEQVWRDLLQFHTFGISLSSPPSEQRSGSDCAPKITLSRKGRRELLLMAEWCRKSGDLIGLSRPVM